VDRATWLAARRAAVEDDYTQDASTYDDGYDPATPVHRRFVALLIEATPAGGSVLDAACGTAPYAGMVLDAGRSYVGIDQSAGMLARASAKWPKVRFERIGLQEVAFDGSFDAAMCVDAMEHVPPEEWPRVLDGLRGSLRPGGHLYLTVEEVVRGRLDRAHAAATQAGLPAVHGEQIDGETGGYHHYPDREQVDRWFVGADLEVVEQADEWLDGYGYHHLLARCGKGDSNPHVLSDTGT
jgi:SAM-dependent methyltransferase